MKSIHEVDGILLINLKKRTDRLKECEATLRKQGLWERTERVEGEALARPPAGWRGGTGGFRCLQAHRKALQIALKKGWKTALILEDDLVFHPDFDNLQQLFFKELPEDWGGLYLGPTFRPWGWRKEFRPRREQVTPNVYRILYARGAQARVWTREVMEVLEKEMGERSKKRPFRRNDRIGAHMQADKRWGFYAPAEALVWQKTNQSDTQGRIMAHSAYITEPRMWDEEVREIVREASKIPGWMHPYELKWLTGSATRMRRIVEIGSFKGRSARAMLAGMKLSYDAPRIVCVDPFTGSDVWREHRNPGPQTRRALNEVKTRGSYYEAFVQGVGAEEIGKTVFPLRMKSGDAEEAIREALGGEEADMVFIDGDHTLPGVWEDLVMAKRLLRKGGLLSGHDHKPGFPGVRRAVAREGGCEQGPRSIWYKWV